MGKTGWFKSSKTVHLIRQERFNRPFSRLYLPTRKTHPRATISPWLLSNAGKFKKKELTLITINGNSLTIEQVIQVARKKEKVEIHKKNKELVDKNAAVVEDFVREIRLLLEQLSECLDVAFDPFFADLRPLFSSCDGHIAVFHRRVCLEGQSNNIGKFSSCQIREF